MTHERTNEQTNGRTNEWTNGRTNKWKNEQTNGQTNKRTDEHILIQLSQISNFEFVGWLLKKIENSQISISKEL